MSRIEESISRLHDKEFTSLTEYCLQLGQEILLKQKAGHLSLDLCGQLPFLRESSVTGKRSIDTFEAGCRVILKRVAAELVAKTAVSTEVYHLTTCPCTLAYNEILFERSNDPWPQATHSQRSKTKLLVGTTEGRPTYQDLTAILDSVLHLSQDLLKRPDESELVLKAHRQPQFVEDVVRQVARAAGEHFKNVLPPETEIQVHSISLESIHIHDVECCLETTLQEIQAASRPILEEPQK